MTYKKLFSENLIKRTCCVCGSYWPKSGACDRCEAEMERQEMKYAPSAIAVKRARTNAGLSVKEAAALIGKTERSWYRYESGDRVLDAALFELFKLKVKNQ